MKRIGSSICVAALLAALATGAWWMQRPRTDRQVEQTLPSPSPAADMIVAGLGGFRGLAAEAVWFRADRLWDEGRYGELAQLASWLVFLEPHAAEVWSYAAWNLAYNVSVAMPSKADRWRWVKAGLQLLLNDGLRLNPSDPGLYKAISDMFAMKLGGKNDDAADYYRARWKDIVRTAQESGDWSETKLDPAKMETVDEEYGAQDWTHPLASALYWAHWGLQCARSRKDRTELMQCAYQSLMMEANIDPRHAPRALAAMEAAMRESPSPALADLIRGFSERFGLSSVESQPNGKNDKKE